MVKREIKNLITKSVKALQKKGYFSEFKISEIKIEHPEEKAHGDYATNVAMVIAKQIKKNPLEIAENLKSEILNFKSSYFDKVEIAGPGFINFFISKEYLQKKVGEILKQKDKFGQLRIGHNKKVQIEFISANPTGPLTIGNARGGPFGDVLGNVLKRAGFRVEKEYYINDYGMQILTLGHSVLKDGEAQYKGDYIDYLNKKIKEKDPYRAGESAAKIIIEEMIKKTISRMGIKYNEWFSENSLHKSGKVDEALEVLNKKGLIYEKEGAKWFRSSKYGDERDRVVVKADGLKTYLAGDIAYHRYKFEKKEFDKVIDEFIQYKNLIIDLTETPSGGNTTVARSIMGRFINKTMPYQQHEFDEKEFDTKRKWVEYVTPRKTQYKGKVFVIVGRWTGSMGEGIAIGFDGLKRAKVIGTKMAGLLGAINGFRMSETNIGFQIPTERLYHINGTPREKYKPTIPTENIEETYKRMNEIK